MRFFDGVKYFGEPAPTTIVVLDKYQYFFRDFA